MFLLLFIYPTGILASDNNIETKIWLLEEDYVAGFRDAADDKVIPRWRHEHFLGWPASEARPADKQAVVEYLRKHAAVPGTWSFQIEKAGIQIHRDVAITHFILQRTVDSDAGAAVKRSSRVTHTWIREDPPMEDPWRHECRIQVINQRFFIMHKECFNRLIARTK